MSLFDSRRHLHFCTMCGNCCRWPGYVRMTDEEMDEIAEFLGMTTQDFIDEYTTLTPDRQGLTLIEKEENDDCIFFESPNTCRIYPIRPKQCRDFPNKWHIPNLEEHCSSIRVRYTHRREKK